MQLPRYIDKIRLHLAGQLAADYQPNLGKGFDGKWLEYAGVQHTQFVDVVRNTITDGQVADWVLANVKKSDADKKALRDYMLHYPKAGDTEMEERLALRKQQSGLAHRDDIKGFVDYIDADEGRI